MFGFFKKAPKLEMTFTPRTAVARELAKEVEVAGELSVRNAGKDAEVSDLQVVLVAGGTRRIDLELPAAWKGTQRIPGGGELRQTVAWTVKRAARSGSTSWRSESACRRRRFAACCARSRASASSRRRRAASSS